MSNHKAITIIKANTDHGVHVNGASQGPTTIVQAWSPTYPLIDIPTPTTPKSTAAGDKAKNLTAVNDFNRQLFAHAQEVLAAGHHPLTLGGDHSLAIGSALGSCHHHGPMGIIWIDAHTDYHTAATTISGNLHGWPLAAITGQPDTQVLTPFAHNFIDSHQAVIIGARDVETPEWDNLRRGEVKVYTDNDCQQQELTTIAARALERATARHTTPIHLSIDLDVINPEIAPGVSVPAVGGLTVSQVITLVTTLLQNCDQIVSIDLVEYNPSRDVQQKTLSIALQILETIEQNWQI
ncbi:arginase [bacterium]|nr:arginase [bacterium]